MILTALNDYYHRLLANPDLGTGLAKVPPYGFSEQQISYCLVLSKTGELIDVEDVRDTSGKKARPKLMSVPSPFARPGQYTQKAFDSGKENAFFLWDKTAYALGLTLDKDNIAFSGITFASFRRFHSNALEASEDEGLKAFSLFIQNWLPENHEQSKLKLNHIDANLVFKLDGDFDFMHQRPAAQALWSQLMQPEADAVVSMGDCLVTGQHSPLARLHPAIKGVYGGQTAGGSIVSFNAEAYTSYGKEQGDNAPVSEAATFAYTTALNFLLRRDNEQCVSIGDASTVFWATSADASKAAKAEQLFGFMMNMPSDDGQQTAQIKPILEKIAQGKPLAEIAPDLDTGTRFYVLGLAPNASRLSIRYWLDTTFGELANNVAQHFQDLMLEPLPWREPPSVWRLLIQTASQGKSENIPPQLAGELLRSIVTGQRYPRMLLAQLVQRVRADGDLNGLRIALLKAVLVRDYRKGFIKEEIPMGLDEQNALPAYRLGRLFSVLERIQEAALGKDVNATIADRYYGTASSVPYSVFPRLLAGCKNHLSKIRKDKPGYAVSLNKDLASVIDGLPTEFPKHFSIEQQGQFAIGYYHQKQRYFTKKIETSDSETKTETAGE
jgi:CRISPR-associated protein Csd1